MITLLFVLVVVFVCDGINLRFTRSRMGFPKLIGGGYGYCLNKGLRQAPYWKCDQQQRMSCLARIATNSLGKKLVPKGTHCHPPNPKKY